MQEYARGYGGCHGRRSWRGKAVASAGSCTRRSLPADHRRNAGQHERQPPRFHLCLRTPRVQHRADRVRHETATAVPGGHGPRRIGRGPRPAKGFRCIALLLILLFAFCRASLPPLPLPPYRFPAIAASVSTMTGGSSKAPRRRRAARASTIRSGPPSACPTIGPSKGPSIPRPTLTPARCPSPERAGTASTSPCLKAARDRTFSVLFDGAMSNARVWLNGQELGGRPYGYIGFAFDLTPNLHFGAQENVLAVRLTPEDRCFALVSGRRHLSQRLAGYHRAGARGRCGALTSPPRRSPTKRAPWRSRPKCTTRGQPAAKLVLRTSVVDAAGKQVASVSNAAGRARHGAIRLSPAA